MTQGRLGARIGSGLRPARRRSSGSSLHGRLVPPPPASPPPPPRDAHRRLPCRRRLRRLGTGCMIRPQSSMSRHIPVSPASPAFVRAGRLCAEEGREGGGRRRRQRDPDRERSPGPRSRFVRVRPLRPLFREAARGVVDVAGAGQSDRDRDPAPGASQDGLGGRPRSPPRTRDCGPRGCARRASPGLPDLRQASVGTTGVVEGVPTRSPRRAAPGAACCWSRSNRSRPELRARLLLSEQPCTILPLRSCNFLGIGTMCALVV